jgi:hypothetical protein
MLVGENAITIYLQETFVDTCAVVTRFQCLKDDYEVRYGTKHIQLPLSEW